MKFPFLKPRIIALGLILFFNTACQEEVNAPEGFELNPLFQMELVASEPLVFDPVDMKFDAQGNAFVLEMPGYPLRDEQSRLIVLEDLDNDGVFDKRHLFADSLFVASSIMPYKGGILVASPPELLFLKDTNQDHKADVREVLMEGFEVGNLQHNYNGLTFGLDNWIYMANGGNNGAPHFKGKPEEALPLRGEDFRIKLETGKLERVGESSGGFELAFDEWGHMFQTHNLEHVSQLIFPGYYMQGIPTSPSHSLHNVSNHEENGLSRIYTIGEQETRVNHPEQSGYFSGACGITFYGGNDFPEGYNNNLFVNDVVLNLVHLDVLSENGAAYKSSRMREKVEFLASTDRSFRPVNMVTSPDAALYLMDMHRSVIEHPEWIPDEIEEKLDLAAGKDKGRIYKITKKGQAYSAPYTFEKGNWQQAVESLGHPNQWVRMTAQRLLVEGNMEESVPKLKDLCANSQNALARLHAMWTLDGLAALSNEELLAALDDEVVGIRENAIKIAEPRLNLTKAFSTKLVELMKDAHPRVRMQACLSLSTLEEQASMASDIRSNLSALLGQDQDLWTQMAALALASKQAASFTESLLNNSVTNQLNKGQSYVLRHLGELLGQTQNEAAISQMLVSLQGNDQVSNETKSKLLAAFAHGWSQSDGQRGNAVGKWNSILNEIETSNSIVILHASAKFRKATGLPPSKLLANSLTEATSIVLDPNLQISGRLEALQLIGLDAFENREDFLYQLLDHKMPVALQEAALRQLWEADEPRVAKALLNRWDVLGPEARKHAGNILLYKAYNHDHLLTALEEGDINMGELNLDLERRRVLLFSSNEQVKSRAEALFSDAGVVQRKEAIEQMRPALEMHGDIAKGKTLFASACGECHQYGEIGKAVGPVLTEINRKSKEALLYEILDPNAAVDTRYVNHQVRTEDGNIYQGMIQRETDEEITLVMMGAVEHTIRKADIAEFRSLGTSLMPEGLESGLSQEDMASLLAFLQAGGD